MIKWTSVRTQCLRLEGSRTFVTKLTEISQKLYWILLCSETTSASIDSAGSTGQESRFKLPYQISALQVQVSPSSYEIWIWISLQLFMASFCHFDSGSTSFCHSLWTHIDFSFISFSYSFYYNDYSFLQIKFILVITFKETTRFIISILCPISYFIFFSEGSLISRKHQPQDESNPSS